MIDFKSLHEAAETRVKEQPHSGVSAQTTLTFDEVELSAGTQAAAARSKARKVNDIMAIFLTALVLIAPIPAGSNRPVFWMLWATVLGLAGAVYMLSMWRADPTRELRIRGLRPLLLLGLAMIAGAALQLIPIGWTQIDTLPDAVQPAFLTLSGGATLLGILRLGSYVLIFVLVSEVATLPSRVTLMGWAVFLGVALHALWGLMALTLFGDSVYWGEKTAYLGVATGTFVNRNSFATFLGMGLMTGVALTMKFARRPYERVPGGRRALSLRNLETAALWLAVGLIAITILATQSRMGTFASALGAITTFFIMRTKASGRIGSSAAWATLAVLLTGTALALLFGQDAIERGLFVGGAAATRGDLYAQVVHMILARPLTGYGLDTFPMAYEAFHQPPVSVRLVWEYAHNTYLTLWAELGLVFGTLPMIAVALAANRLVAIVRRRKTSYALPAAALGAIILGAVHSLVDFSLEIEANTFLFLYLLALGLGQLRRRKDSMS